MLLVAIEAAMRFRRTSSSCTLPSFPLCALRSSRRRLRDDRWLARELSVAPERTLPVTERTLAEGKPEQCQSQSPLQSLQFRLDVKKRVPASLGPQVDSVQVRHEAVRIACSPLSRARPLE